MSFSLLTNPLKIDKYLLSMPVTSQTESCFSLFCHWQPEFIHQNVTTVGGVWLSAARNTSYGPHSRDGRFHYRAWWQLTSELLFSLQNFWTRSCCFWRVCSFRSDLLVLQERWAHLWVLIGALSDLLKRSWARLEISRGRVCFKLLTLTFDLLEEYQENISFKVMQWFIRSIAKIMWWLFYN